MLFLKIIYKDKKEKQIGISDRKDGQKVIDEIVKRANRNKAIDASRMYKVGNIWYTIEHDKVDKTEIIEV